MRKLIHIFLLSLVIAPCWAGVDLSGYVQRIWIKNDDILMIKMKESSFDTYCQPGWMGFNLYIPTSDKNFPYYYGLITTAIAKKQPLFIANISTFNGTTACDLTKTGYGIVLQSTD